MLKVECEIEADYKLRCGRVVGKLVDKPEPSNGKPLVIRDRNGLTELSFLFFTGWLFTSILNQSKVRYSLGLVPVGPNGESSLLVLYRKNTHLATPARRIDEFLDPEYFICPLDRAKGVPLTETEKHLCPVVNKIRYNLGHARPGGDVTGLQEPKKTAQCCNSNKADLWSYLASTVQTDPDLYGPMVGGTVFPIKLPYKFLSDYLTGTPPRPDDFGKLLEETLLWFSMAAASVLIGVPHCKITNGPVPTNEIDLLLYDLPVGGHKAQKDEPAGGWAAYLANHAVCLLELTVGHQPDMTKKDAEDEDGPGRTGYTGAGSDKPANKVMNFQALSTCGFRLVQTHYIAITGSQMSEVTRRVLATTPRFTYTCLAELLCENINGLVLNHEDKPVTNATARRWHEELIKLVEDTARQFRATLDGK